VRFIGKSHTERYTGGSFRKGAYRTLNHELVSHRRGRPTPTSAASKASESPAGEPTQPSPLDGRWEGEQGIWGIKGRVSGRSIEGSIQCRSNDVWSARSPMFSGTVEDDGSVEADTTEELKGCGPRES